MKLVQVSFLFLMLVSLPLFYNNCGALHEGIGANSSASVKDRLKSEFASGYSPFLKTNCSACHVAGGSGSGKFASPNLDEAYTDFYGIGYQKISEYAVNNGHNFPYTGSQNQEKINQLKESWEEALIRAMAGSGEEQEEDRELIVFTDSKIISLADAETSRVMRWVIPQGIESSRTSLSGLDGVTIEAQANLIEVDGNLVGYAISRPKLSVPATSSKGVRLDGIESFVNNNLVNANTFSKFSVCVKPGESAFLSNSGSSVVDMAPSVSDRLSIATYGLQLEDCLSEDDFPEVAFSVSQTSLAEGSPTTGYASNPYPFVDMEISLSEPALVDSRVKVLVSGASSANKRVFGDKNRFDWDFDFDDTAIVFLQGERTKTIRIDISNDQRVEGNETAVIELRDPVNLKIGAASSFTITINDDDPEPTGSVVRYTDVMNRLFLNSGLSGCIECHNSKSAAGGLDITDHRQMYRSGVISPKDIDNSPLYQRTKGIGGSIMPPGSSGLSPEDDQMIRDWINDGAKNN